MIFSDFYEVKVYSHKLFFMCYPYRSVNILIFLCAISVMEINNEQNSAYVVDWRFTVESATIYENKKCALGKF